MDHHNSILNQHRAITVRQLHDTTFTIKEIDASLSGNPLRLQQHRAIAVKQLHDITSAIIDIDALLSDNPLPTSTIFTVDDKVISLTSPNKDRIGFVTKVTQNYIHVNPINTKFKPFKKITENLAHFPLRGSQPLFKDNTHSDHICPDKNQSPNTTSSAHPPQSSPPSLPPPKTHITLPTTSSSPDTSTTLSISTLPTPTRSSSTRLIQQTISIIQPTTRARKRHILNPTRHTSVARTARCARSDTRSPQSKRSKR